MTFEVIQEMEYIAIQVSYVGNAFYDPIDNVYGETVQVIPPPGGLSTRVIIIIVASSVLFAVIVAFVVYQLVKAKPFEELMEKVTEEEKSELGIL